MVVMDTCAVMELVKEKPTFTTKALQQIHRGIYILSISFAEIACKIKLGKLEMSVSPNALYAEFLQTEHVQIINIGVEEWLDAIQLDWDENKDPADRVITAFALKKHLSLVTIDKRIKQFYPKTIW